MILIRAPSLFSTDFIRVKFYFTDPNGVNTPKCGKIEVQKWRQTILRKQLWPFVMLILFLEWYYADFIDFKFRPILRRF